MKGDLLTCYPAKIISRLFSDSLGIEGNGLFVSCKKSVTEVVSAFQSGDPCHLSMPNADCLKGGLTPALAFSFGSAPHGNVRLFDSV